MSKNLQEIQYLNDRFGWFSFANSSTKWATTWMTVTPLFTLSNMSTIFISLCRTPEFPWIRYVCAWSISLACILERKYTFTVWIRTGHRYCAIYKYIDICISIVYTLYVKNSFNLIICCYCLVTGLYLLFYYLNFVF